MFFALFLSLLLRLSLSLPIYNLQDISQISLFSSSAVYNPLACPHQLTFRSRAVYNSAIDRLILPVSSLHFYTQKKSSPCKASVKNLLFKPIGSTKHYPPQWLFQDPTYQQRAVNFTCGKEKFSIKFGYFNDVKTPAGFLNRGIVYFDFAVFPYTTPFSYCSYSGTNIDGSSPLDHAPFPTMKTWKRLKRGKSLTNAAHPVS